MAVLLLHLLGVACQNLFEAIKNFSFFFSSRRRHTRWPRDWSSDVCSSDLKDFANMDIKKLQDYIKTCGLYKNKAKNIKNSSIMILKEFDGKVPNNMKDLLKLPGVGRKTANVVLANAFDEDTIAVDTHVHRVSNRIGLADSKDVLNTEKDLMKNLPKSKWSNLHHQIIAHGRKVCKARNPLCHECDLKDLCEYYKENL